MAVPANAAKAGGECRVASRSREALTGDGGKLVARARRACDQPREHVIVIAALGLAIDGEAEAGRRIGDDPRLAIRSADDSFWK
jgi:hypothetical protein